ncbi:MAG: fibronectin type III domain-containing protein, partial [Proteobacteria bacterium]|nr:fibronectin type III domain-containing protein [Pseudomonadota bacterium]
MKKIERARNGGQAISKYIVQWDDNINFSSSQEASVDGSESSFVIPGLSTGKQYFVRLLACNSIGCGTPSRARAMSAAREVQVLT